MADDDEYYFEDDYGDDGDDDDGEVTWETEIENLYAEAKSNCDSDCDEAIRNFKQVIEDDQDNGKWTFKALKGIYRVAAKYHRDDITLQYFEKMLAHQWDGRTRNDIEKAINKFIDRSTHLSEQLMSRVYDITLKAISSDLKNFDKLWFNLKLRVAQLLLQNREFRQLAEAVSQLHEWCGSGEAAEQRKGTQMLSVYALEIQLHTEEYDPTKIRRIYQKAMAIKSAIPSPKVLGVLRESGGKMYMRQNQWADANDCFFHAFRSFDEAGDPRRIANLKYLVLATMLSGSKINPFDSNEAKSYKSDPEIVAMTELIHACTHNDIKQFDRVLKDKKNSASIMKDTFLYSYLEPLIRKIRCQVLLVLSKPYKRVRIEYLAQELMISTPDAEALCVAMILDNQLHAAIDQPAGVLMMTSSSTVTDRYGVMDSLNDRAKGLHAAIVRRATN